MDSHELKQQLNCAEQKKMVFIFDIRFLINILSQTSAIVITLIDINIPWKRDRDAEYESS